MKISDFGLAKECYRNSEYKKKSNVSSFTLMFITTCSAVVVLSTYLFCCRVKTKQYCYLSLRLILYFSSRVLLGLLLLCRLQFQSSGWLWNHLLTKSTTSRPTCVYQFTLCGFLVGGHNLPDITPGSELPCQWQGRTKPPGPLMHRL